MLVGPRGSLLLLTHVEARIRSRPFIVDGGPTSSTSACTRPCILGVCIRFAPEGRALRGEARSCRTCIRIADPVIHLQPRCILRRYRASGSFLPSSFPAWGRSRFAIRYRVQCDAYGSSGATCRPVRGLWMTRDVVAAGYSELSDEQNSRSLPGLYSQAESTNVAVFIYLRLWSVGPFLQSIFTWPSAIL